MHTIHVALMGTLIENTTYQPAKYSREILTLLRRKGWELVILTSLSPYRIDPVTKIKIADGFWPKFQRETIEMFPMVSRVESSWNKQNHPGLEFLIDDTESYFHASRSNVAGIWLDDLYWGEDPRNPLSSRVKIANCWLDIAILMECI